MRNEMARERFMSANIAHNQDLEGVRLISNELKEIGPDALHYFGSGRYRIAMEAPGD